MLHLWGGDVFVCVDGVYGWVCVGVVCMVWMREWVNLTKFRAGL